MKLLMHACCAPCSVYCIDELRKENIEPTLFWYNPNIHPFKEYEARRNCLVDYCKKINLECIVEDEYGLEKFCKNVIDDLDVRCSSYCYPVRLRKAFEYAKNNGYDAVTTTLLYSIYQKHYVIKYLGEQLAQEFGIDFYYKDFRYGFWVGHDKAMDEGFYMQQYCGCIFSEEDRFVKDKKQEIILPEGMEWANKNRRIEVKPFEKNNNIPDFPNIHLSFDEKEYVYSLNVGENATVIAVLNEKDNNNIELSYIETLENKRNRGYASKLIKSLEGNYKHKYKNMLVTPGADTIPFFVKNGFDKYVDEKFYLKNLK